MTSILALLEKWAKYLVVRLRHFYYWRQLRYPNRPIRLHLGCGHRRLEGFVNVDRNVSWATDFIADAGRLPCPDCSVERIENYHVIEHIPQPSVQDVLGEWHRVLRRGGQLIIECPDIDQAMKEYLEGNEERLFSVYGRQRFRGDTHHWGYSGNRLQKLLESCGFADAKLTPAQDYHVESEPCLRLECIKP